MDCIVVGAGVAGIAATQALRGIGANVTCLERAPQARGSGYQLNILGNGRYALDRIGLLDALGAAGAGCPLAAGVTIDGRTGRRLQVVRLNPQSGRYAGASYFRSDVHANLLAGLEGDGPIYGTGVETVADEGDDPVAVLDEHGTERRADVVVVADGAHSRLRASLLGGRHIVVPWMRFILAAAQIDVEGSSEAERMFRRQVEHREFPQILFPNTCVVLSYAGRGRLGLIVGLFGRDARGAIADDELETAAKRAVAGIRDARVHHAIESACWRADDPARRPLLLRGGSLDPLPAYSRDRVALVGDSAHAMLPVLGQGANQSFEDAMVLAECLRPAVDAVPPRRASAVRASLAAYSRERVPHVTPIQLTARRLAASLVSHGWLRHALNCRVARSLPRGLVRRQSDHVMKYALADPLSGVSPVSTPQGNGRDAQGVGMPASRA